MRRFLLLAVVAALVGATIPADAAPTRRGTILAPAVTPTHARALFNAAGPASNGVIGYAFPVSPSAKGSTYVLTKTTPLPGNVDVWFYTDDDGRIGEPCSPVIYSEDGTPLDSTTETGVICPGAGVPGWALVILFSGVGLSFTLTY